MQIINWKCTKKGKIFKNKKYIEKYGRITRAEYEKLNNVSERTSNRELNNLINRRLIEKEGKGPETHYVLARYDDKTERRQKMNKILVTRGAGFIGSHLQKNS